MPINPRERWQKIAQMRRFNGSWQTARWLGHQISQRVLRMSAFHLVWMETDMMRALPPTPPGFDFRFLTADDVRRFASDPELDLSLEFAERLAAGHEFCFAALDGERLASYCWFALGCIEAEHNHGVALSYADDVAYNYKAFTHEDYRGRKLRGITTGLAFREMQKRGVSKLVGTVESTNLASMKSCLQLGFVDIGAFRRYGPAGWNLYRYPSEPRRLGLRMGPEADLLSRRSPQTRRDDRPATRDEGAAADPANYDDARRGRPARQPG